MTNYRITVEDMHCNKCANKITEALQALSEKTACSCNVDKHFVDVETDMSAADIFEAIEDAGFTPTDLELM